MRISKMYFVMQMLKKVFSVENGFGMVVTKKGLEAVSKKVCILKAKVTALFLVIVTAFGVGVLGVGFLGFQAISAQGCLK